MANKRRKVISWWMSPNFVAPLFELRLRGTLPKVSLSEAAVAERGIITMGPWIGSWPRVCPLSRPHHYVDY